MHVIGVPKMYAEMAAHLSKPVPGREAIEIDSAVASEPKGGSLHLAKLVALAPMSGITDAPFRRLVFELGAGLVVSEMTASEAFATGDARARLRAERQGIGLHVVQLAGCEPYWMAEAARIAQGSGADIVDINMGCPAKKVTGGLSGSALMRDLDHALALIDATVAAVNVPVTLKMRLGWDDHSINAPELARRAELAGVQLLTVHGRTRCQFYGGSADPAAIAIVKQSVRIPVIANGDVVSFDSAERMLAQSGADGVMVGRGAQGRPWFPGQLARYFKTGVREPEPDLPVQLRLITRLYEDVLSHHGLGTGVRHARKHLSWALNVAAGCVNAPMDCLKSAREQILTAADPKQVLCRLNEGFDRFGAAA